MNTTSLDGAARARRLAACAVGVCVAGLGDYMTGWATSFALIYLVPIGAAEMWAGSKRGAIALGAVAGVARLGVALSGPVSLAAAFWNAGVTFGLLLVFAVALGELRRYGATATASRSVGKAVTAGLLTAALMGLTGLALQREVPAAANALRMPGFGEWGRAGGSTPPATMPQGAPVGAVMTRGADLSRARDALLSALPASRAVLLGSRDPAVASCVTPVLTGQVRDRVPDNPGDYDGGPGTRLAAILFLDRQGITLPSQDYGYMQGRVRRYLENQAVANDAPTEGARMLHEAAAALADALDAPDAAVVAAEILRAGEAGEAKSFADRSNWPGWCLTELCDALRAGDVPRARRWARELETAAFALHDLHRWLGFLTRNYLEALDFQARCSEMFPLADAAVARATSSGKYEIASSPSMQPAGIVTLHGGANFYEVEHRAERMLSMPQDRRAAWSTDRVPTLAELRVPPVTRATWSRIRASLSEANRAAWDSATRTPFEFTYMVNMIDRADRGGATEPLLTAMANLNARRPAASLPELWA